jgi:hypothetical protein
VSPETVLATISAGIAAFFGLGKSLNGFNDKLDRRFQRLEEDVNALENNMVHHYVLKQDFLREMQAVHQKLDRIWEYMINSKG